MPVGHHRPPLAALVVVAPAVDRDDAAVIAIPKKACMEVNNRCCTRSRTASASAR
ncbi:MAG: hypothetical protein QOE52_5092 [Mycobacterium sp.]|nr:hypothetical protein [Mycobacterium sp.]